MKHSLKGAEEESGWGRREGEVRDQREPSGYTHLEEM